jgi:GTPase SAR1 family protein
MEYLKTEKEDKEAYSKILFTGLDNAGKTSILLSLKREFSKIANVSPTRGAQRKVFDFLGKTISEWDLGGQKLYRISYIRNPSKYFSNTEIAIYVIDIQDKKRIPEAISYLEDVIKKFEELNIKPPIYILFHKFDPALEKNALNEYTELIINLKEDIKKSTNYQRLYFYRTSIHEIENLVLIMSDIFRTLIDRPEAINNTLKEFSQKEQCDGVCLIDNNSLIIGSYYKNDRVESLLSKAPPYFLRMNDRYDQIEETVNLHSRYTENKITVQRKNHYYIFEQIRDDPPYYILLARKSPLFDDDTINSLGTFLDSFI